MNEQVIKRLVGYNYPPGTPLPTFHLGRIDDDRLAAAGVLISSLLSGGVVAPDEPWIGGFWGCRARSAGPLRRQYRGNLKKKGGHKKKGNHIGLPLRGWTL